MSNEERKNFLTDFNIKYEFAYFTIDSNTIILNFFIESQKGRALAYKIIGCKEFCLDPCYWEIINKKTEDFTQEDYEIDELEGIFISQIEKDKKYKDFYKKHAGDIYSGRTKDFGFEGVPLFYFNKKFYKVGAEKIELIGESL